MMKLARGITLFMLLAATSTAQAATFVYVSNSGDGTISIYAMAGDGTLMPQGSVQAGATVMPLNISPNKRFLFAAVRTKPYSAITYAIDPRTGALKELSRAPLAESFPYIYSDNTGRYLLGASFGGNLVSVNAIGRDGKVSEPQQVIPTARNAHSIITDKTNRYVYVPHLGTDQIFQFRFDEKTGKLTANTPPIVQLKAGTGPRHIIVSGDNRFAYLLSELAGTVTTLSLDPKTGLLSEVSVTPMWPPGESLKDMPKKIWASDLHLTPDGNFLYAAERTSSTIKTFRVEAASGKLTYLSSTPTEKQPRGFSIHPKGKYMVVSGELSDTISVYALEADGRITFLQMYPTGKGANWVEIVSFDK